MVSRRDIASWLNGPGVASDTPSPYPGARLGLPESGSGSVARPGRRLLGIAIDWLSVWLIAATFLRSVGPSAGPLLVLLVEHTLLVGTAGFSLGHRLVGVRVARLDGGPAGIGRAALRSVLLCLAVPPLIWDRDQRGLHDKAAGTVVVRL
jgi:uncharacterized RDD family membrane protein YckC